MRKDLRIDYTIRWLVMSMGWRSVIAEYDPPRRFVDEQEKGPYAFWRHEHTFRAVENGVKVGDRIKYALPFGVLGQLAHAAVVERQLLDIFRYRQQRLAGLLGVKTRDISIPRVR
jgi:ligand-binding SRPBCC domain-containing protein